jgi:hypothetical protein
MPCGRIAGVSRECIFAYMRGNCMDEWIGCLLEVRKVRGYEFTPHKVPNIGKFAIQPPE